MIVRRSSSKNGVAMNYAQTIYQRSLPLPDSAAQQDTAAFLRAVAGGWGNDIPDDIDDTDLGADTPRDSL
jgi:hypothetical protein